MGSGLGGEPPPHEPAADPTVGLWGPELSGKGEGCTGPQATHVVLHRGQRGDAVTDEPTAVQF